MDKLDAYKLRWQYRSEVHSDDTPIAGVLHVMQVFGCSKVPTFSTHECRGAWGCASALITGRAALGYPAERARGMCMYTFFGLRRVGQWIPATEPFCMLYAKAVKTVLFAAPSLLLLAFLRVVFAVASLRSLLFFERLPLSNSFQ